MAVTGAVIAGTVVGLIFGKQAAGQAVLGTAFVNLIKMIDRPDHLLQHRAGRRIGP